MQDIQRMVRKHPRLLGQWNSTQHKFLLSDYNIPVKQLWSCAILRTRRNKATAATSIIQRIQAITHLKVSSNLRHPNTPTPLSSHRWASRAAGGPPLLQVQIGSLICSKACRWSSVQRHPGELQHPTRTQEDLPGTSVHVCNPLKSNGKKTELHNYA